MKGAICIMLTIHIEYLTGLIISQWDFVSIELIQIVCYELKIVTDRSVIRIVGFE